MRVRSLNDILVPVMTLLFSLSIVGLSFLSGGPTDFKDSTVAQPESIREKYINDLASLYTLYFPVSSPDSSKITAAQVALGSFLRFELKRTMKTKLANTDIKTLRRMTARLTPVQQFEFDSAGTAYDSLVRKISYVYMNKDIKQISEQGYNIFDLFMNELPPDPSTEDHLLRSGLVLIGHIKEEHIVKNAAPNQIGRYLIIQVDQVIKENEIFRKASGKTLDTIILSRHSGAPIGMDIDAITSKDKNGRKRTYLFYLEEKHVGYCGFGPPVDPIVKHSPSFSLEFFPFEVVDSTIRKVKASSSNRHATSLKEFRRIARRLSTLKGMEDVAETFVR